MQRPYPVNEEAPCWHANAFDAHDLVYMGPCMVELPTAVVMINGSPIDPGNLPAFLPISLGPMKLYLHRCVDCGIGVMHSERREGSRDPTNEERVWLRAIETTSLVPE